MKRAVSMEEDIGVRVPSLPRFVFASAEQKLDELWNVTSIYHIQKQAVLLLRVLSPLLPPAQYLKQHIVPAALDFHFNTMSFFKQALSEAFRLNAEQTPVASLPLPSLTQSMLSSNLSRHGPACASLCV